MFSSTVWFLDQMMQIVEERAALEKDADLEADRGQLPFRQPDDVFAVDPNLPGIGRHQSDEMFQEHALAGAAPANDDERFALRHRQIDAAQNLLASESFRQSANVDHRRVVRHYW
jgi:hypothetical protein